MKKAKLRKEEGSFVVEGIKMAAEAVLLERVEKIYATERGFEALVERLERQPECPVELVSEQVFSGISDTVSPQGVLALVGMVSYSLDRMMESENANLLFLEEVRDPGNLGTIFRTAECAGVNGIVLSSGCVDVYNPKVVRATMGAVFRMPFVCVEDFIGVIEETKRHGVRIFGASLLGERDFFEEDFRGKTGVVIGNEANGMSKEAEKAADVLVRIPMEGGAESLNASMAAGVMMYEGYRQKRYG
jgi:TrmH family RNA methyltransferase